MTFTWWTYFVAMRKAICEETLEYSQHMAAFRGPDKWISRCQFTDTLRRRRRRERR